ncbi:hypothetical protein FE257_012988 [Aspergillus nanangensis]|uniref:PNPLA domain-containing protein n=1 Tax=Aspergillus nanangensis TaxID=2582783 RepID=A0AAD4GQC3_ASPNN|nr:hypothetical protein FE257_012988 [Aspergillus nanangensis]
MSSGYLPPEKRPLSILAFDGGGLRGLAALYVLRELMVQVSWNLQKENGDSSTELKRVLKPCEAFDVIGGASTGGIFAIMLAIWGLSVDEAINLYKRHFLFEEDTRVGSTTSTLFSEDRFQLHASNLFPGNPRLKVPPEAQPLTLVNRCHVIVLAQDITTGKPHSFHNVGNQSGFDVIKIPQICQATCALPGFLPPIEIHSANQSGDGIYAAIDISTMHTVPEIVREARRLIPGEKIGVITSISSGAPPWRPQEQGSSRWTGVVKKQSDLYHATVRRADIVDIEHAILKWTSYTRLDIGQSTRQAGLKEVKVTELAQVQKACDGFCSKKSRILQNAAKDIGKSIALSWYETVSFEENRSEVQQSILHLELLTLKRLLSRDRDLHPPRGRLASGMSALILKDLATELEQEAAKIWGIMSPHSMRAAYIVEFLKDLTTKNLTDVQLLNVPQSPWPPSQLELTKTLIPCHKSTPDLAAWVLDTCLHVVFPTRERAEWIWKLAQQSDAEVRSNLWMENVPAISLQHSSDVLQLIRKRLSNEFPRGPWSGGPEDLQSVAGGRQVIQMKSITNANTNLDVSEILESVRKDYMDYADEYRAPGVTQGQAAMEDLSNRVDSYSPFKKTLPIYQYSRLPDGAFTRVIVLRPATTIGEELFCDIQFLDLNQQAYKYDALSYVWGSHDLLESLNCNGQTIRITAHVASALRRFRSQLVPRVLWIDALCINQRDTTEKARHVHLMSAIYQRARCALVYLGSPERGQEKYIYFLLRLSQTTESYGTAVTNADKNNQSIRDTLTEVFGTQDLTHVEKMTKIPWFTRRWIVQEAALAKTCVVFFGRSIAPMEPVHIAMAMLSNSAVLPPKVNRGAMDNMLTINAVQNYRKRFIGQPADYTILDVLINCHAADTSEPRDRLYALLSIAPDTSTGDIPVHPDYENFVGDIYTDFAMACLRKSPTLDILHCAGSFRHPPPSSEGLNPFFENGTMGLPSFVPDWTARRRYFPLHGIHRFTAGFCGRVAQRQLERHQLRLPSLMLDYIRMKTTPPPFILTPKELVTVFGMCMLLYERFKAPPGGKLSSYPTETLARTLIADHALRDAAIAIKCGPKPSSEVLAGERKSHADIRQAMWTGFATFRQDWQKHKNVDFLKRAGGNVVLLQLHYAKLFCETMQGRSFFISDKGYMGIAPEECVEGDAIVVPLGMRTPFVIRPHAVAGGNAHTIVGDCYVDGFMEGEAFRTPGVREVNVVIA